ncbi:galactokinase [Winogradskyella sediminis]|uniref:Galactokinase n=1 Tax=Winogradskyella sediminis TaxID=1382466 RepID=A0A1H1SP58_9FLAO|nr:galactokinase [Winogradskyella sediminis]SDS49516.1 galactokinase [Winogradskyella sediminis]
MSKKLIKEVKQSFEKQFKTEPILVFSPGRINLIGEHTDYNDGFVFPAAINKGIGLAIQQSSYNTSKVSALNKDESFEFSLDDIKPVENGGWRNYILGVVSELQNLGLKIGNFNSVFAGDIPGGAGMSSSAALENSFVYGLNTLFDLGLSKAEMILVSQKAEHNYAGVKCGIMDQYASMFGVKKSALLLDCRTVASEPFKIDFGDYKLMLINTNVKHDLSESAYNDRRSVCEMVSEKLNIKALRDATLEDLDTLKPEITEADYQKASYVIEENNRVQLFSKAIKEHDLEALGALLYQSHDGLSNKFKVSCVELDFLVQEAKQNKNVLGARMMGGGFGGCTINLILKHDFKKFKKEVSKKFQSEFGRSCSVYGVKLSQGTHLVN